MERLAITNIEHHHKNNFLAIIVATDIIQSYRANRDDKGAGEMTMIYVYSLEDNNHIATITGADNAACEAKADEIYGSNDYGWTYSPAFGAADGLTENADAEEIKT